MEPSQAWGWRGHKFNQIRLPCGTSCSLLMQDAKTGSSGHDVPAAEHGCGSLCIQRLCDILPVPGTLLLLGLRSYYNFHWGSQQCGMPGQRSLG